MSDLRPIPGWECICDDGDVTLVESMVSNDGITSEIVPVGARGRNSKRTPWVSATDYDRAAGSVRRHAGRAAQSNGSLLALPLPR